MQELGKHGRDLREWICQEGRKPLGKNLCPLVFKRGLLLDTKRGDYFSERNEGGKREKAEKGEGVEITFFLLF